MEILAWYAVVLLLLRGSIPVRSDASDHKYNVGDGVPLYANKVGPFHNPRNYDVLFHVKGGFSLSANVKEKKEALGEALNGDRLVSAPYKLEFLQDKDSEIVCKQKLNKEEVSRFRSAVSKDYYFQMYYDDLPFWGFLGKVEKKENPIPANTNSIYSSTFILIFFTTKIV